MDLTTILLFCLLVLITHFLEGVTGFGCTAMALPFAIILLGVKSAVPVLAVLAWILALVVIIIDFKKIIWKQYAIIMGFVILGLPIGMTLFTYLSPFYLKILLGIIMIAVSLQKFYTLSKFYAKTKEKQAAGAPRSHKVVSYAVLFFGGIYHGAFASGGPLITIYATKELPEKSNFRATLCTVWATLNTIMIFVYLKDQIFDADMGKLILYSLPFLAIGFILANIAHKRIRSDQFSKLVYGVLLVTGIFMIVSA